MLKKIVIIGPESTGKSTLCTQLAAHYNTIWVREYARAYLLKHGMDYTYDNLLTIAQGQVQLEEEAVNAATASGSRLIFIDTDMQVMKVWCEFVFGKCHDWILEQLNSRRYDLYLLCNTDLPWVKDELREYPDLATREKLFNIYKTAMENQKVPWAEIGGTHEQRLQQAIAAVDELIDRD